MADVNIASCYAHPKKCPIPVSQDTVSFHADADYTLHFKNPDTFGMSSAYIPKGEEPTPLKVVKHVSTGYCISGGGCPGFPPCPPTSEGDGDDGDPFEITIGSEPLKSKKKPYVKTVVKRAADVKAKAAKGKAQPKPAAKKKAALKKPKPAAKTRKRR